MKRWLAVALLMLVVAACSADPYPITPGGGSEGNVTAVGVATGGLVLLLQARPGDRIELTGAEPVWSQPGADVTFFFSPVVIEGTDQVIGIKKEPLAGATFATDRSVASPGYINDVGVWAEVAPHGAGVFTLRSVRLHYRVNGGSEQVKDGINVVLTVCAADPAPSPGDCAPTPSG